MNKDGLRLRILLSYWYYKDVDLDALFAKYFTEPYPEVFADSGGFSAYSQGVEIDWREYGKWIKKYRHLFTTYANLDVIGNPDATAINQKRLEDFGLEPIPVYHTGSDPSYLEGLIEDYPYIALGGMVPYMRRAKQIMPWLVRCFKMAGDKAVFHGFGATAWQVVRSFPWYSVDSSSWGQGFRYGQVPIFDTRKGAFLKLNLGDYKAWQRHGGLVRQMGFDPIDFADRERNDRAKICAISALSYMMAEQWLRKIHGEIRIPGNGGGTSGPKSHLSDTSSGINFGDADRGLKLYGVTAGETVDEGPRAAMSVQSQGSALNGPKLHIADSRPNSGGEIAAAESGLRTYLADSPHTPLRPTAAAEEGLKIHLAEHSLDRGGIGDTSRAMEILDR